MDLPWRIKQRRADEHIRHFGHRCSHYLETANVDLRYDRDPIAGTIRVRFEADVEPPAELGAIIGDVLQNLRSALDAVAWETCQRASIAPDQERHVYFPIALKPERWPNLVRQQLPAVTDAASLEVFRRQQPWYWDEELRSLSDTDISDGMAHPLARLNELARIDRHRVPHPVLARAGDTWLTGPANVTVHLAGAPSPHAGPGETVLNWLVDPPRAVAQLEPDGEAMLVLSDQAAHHRSSAMSELRSMQQAVVEATRAVEIEVLGLVSPAEIDQLQNLADAAREARRALHLLRDTRQVIDAGYIDRYSKASADLETASNAHLDRWRALFD